MKGTFAAFLLAILLAGCKQAGPASSVDPFFGNTRVAPPATGSAQPIPPGTGYYQTQPNGVPTGLTPAVPGGTLPPPPANSTPANPYIPLQGTQGYSTPAATGQGTPTQVYPATPRTIPPGAYPGPGSGRYQNNSSSDPFPSADGSLSPVRRNGAAEPSGAGSPDSSIAQTTALGARGSRVVVPERALNWQVTPRGEPSTFGAEIEPSPRVGGSLPTSGSPLVSRSPTAAEASSRPLSERERIIRTVGPDGRIVTNGTRSRPSASSTIGPTRTATGIPTTAPGYLPPNVQMIDISDLPAAKKRSDSNVRSTSATEPLPAGSDSRSDAQSSIYLRGVDSSNGTSGGTGPGHATTARRPQSSTSGIFHGTLGYSERHRKWCIDLDPTPGKESIVDARRILLADDLLLSGLERGDYVKLEGRIEETGAATDGFPIVKALKVLDFREAR